MSLQGFTDHPLTDPIAVRFRREDVSDNVPFPDVGNNKFTNFPWLALKL